jgi:hypothetical protein
MTSEAIKIAEKRLIEEQVALLHTVAQNKGVLNTGEVTKRGGRTVKPGSLFLAILMITVFTPY